MNPEEQAREKIDRLLAAAGWLVQNLGEANIHAGRGVAIREFPLTAGFGVADSLLYVDAKACGVLEAKPEGVTLTGVEIQSGRYAQGLPDQLPAWRRPLPFLYESTGVETHFTNGLDPEPRARNVFAFHQPGTLADWLGAIPQTTKLTTDGGAYEYQAELAPATFLARARQMPELITSWADGGSERKLLPA